MVSVGDTPAGEASDLSCSSVSAGIAECIDHVIEGEPIVDNHCAQEGEGEPIGDRALEDVVEAKGPK
ncbi:hypothetical protein KIPB_008207, partial [Kipferlia bialata]|eukprot:g8207.t1